jgi:hypothetical protein
LIVAGVPAPTPALATEKPNKETKIIKISTRSLIYYEAKIRGTEAWLPDDDYQRDRRATPWWWELTSCRFRA